ncbi:alternate-type signal peptide domain-containing protein [Gryllotalpicola koreensis]|uniref:Alternate-type signal peptide domain-containing protein n=1 Tax=Gryllotalpicola koreensis TaxID=993086 RepID=A0ABP7ZQ85_9MICO
MPKTQVIRLTQRKQEHLMNRLFKGAIASAAGVALLLGGAGTFALWQDTAGLRGDAIIEAGRLEFGWETMPQAVWTINEQPIAESAVANVRFVPGDVVTMTWEDVPVIVDGDYLVAEFGVSLDGLKLNEIEDPDAKAAAIAFFEGLEHSVEIRQLILDEEDPAYDPNPDWHASTDEFELERGTNTFQVRATVVFDPDAENPTAYGAQIPLTGLGLSIKQVPHDLHTVEQDGQLPNHD